MNRRTAGRAALGVLALVAAGVILRIAPHAPLSRFAPQSSAVYARDGQLLRLTLAADQQYRLWTPLSAVSPEFLAALQLHEDRHFRLHPGVDPLALLRAVAAMGRGGARQGGSTITMQLARLVYRLNTRSVSGKLRQMAMALWLELRYSKDEILEAHVNLAPYGRNIQGIGAASLVYFDKSPAQLSFAEALALALIPQSPRARNPEGEEPESLRAARIALAAAWARQHATAPASLAAAAQTLHFRGLRQLPFAAPHLVAALLRASGDGAAMHTSLSLPMQRLLEKTVQQFIGSQRALGVRNAAAMLVDYRSMQVRAVVGSADFNDAEIGGQVNGTTAKRSPGSALKPFIYALAIDQGLIHTRSMLKDAPTLFGAYAPENFDGAFVGPVSAHDALIASRNVPAVALSARLAQPGFYQFLRNAGVSRLASERHYGLALALGGGEVTMEELVTLYGMLGNGGEIAPLEYVNGTPAAARVRLLSPQATFMVTSMLADNPRPDGLPNTRPRVAWKTGTSWGFRDAWSVGIVGPYVLAVWVGNFDGSGNPAFVGAQIAAPLFFRIVDGIRATQPRLPDLPEQPPPGVEAVEVCAASGELPNAECPQRTQAWFIPGKSPIRVSSVHRRVAIDSRTGLAACADTPRRYLRTELFEYWPSDVQRLYALAGMPRRPVPIDRCNGRAAGLAGVAPAIVYPVSGAVYQLHAAAHPGEALQLRATAASEVASLYWFADGAFVGVSRPSASLAWVPTHTGELALSVVDDQGGTATRKVRVALIP